MSVAEHRLRLYLPQRSVFSICCEALGLGKYCSNIQTRRGCMDPCIWITSLIQNVILLVPEALMREDKTRQYNSGLNGEKASWVAQLIKNPLAVWENWVQSLAWEDPLRKAWQPTPVLLPGESREATVHGITKSHTYMTEELITEQHKLWKLERSQIWFSGWEFRGQEGFLRGSWVAGSGWPARVWEGALVSPWSEPAPSLLLCPFWSLPSLNCQD